MAIISKTVATAFFILWLTFPIFCQDGHSIYRNSAEKTSGINNSGNDTSSVITVDGFDNFFLGVNFADASITEEPATPGQYFATFNINKAYMSSDGHDWHGVSPPWGSYSIQGEVVCAYDGDGNLYFANTYGSPIIQGCIVIKSTNHGSSWSAPVEAVTGIDKSWLVCDQTDGPNSNNIYVTMSAAGNGKFARSTDQGTSFTEMWTFDTQTLPGMMACIGPQDNMDGGTIHVVTNSGNPFESIFTFYCSKDGGETFEFRSRQSFAGYVGTNVNGRHSVNNMQTRPYPYIAADNSNGPFRGRLYLVYASNNPPGNGNKPDIFCHYSDNDGESWSEAYTVNDDFPSILHSQFHPIPWCDQETGYLYIQWMDTRNTPTSDSALIYATYSSDGGQSFQPNVAVSNEKMPLDCITCPGSNTPRYQGDYNGIISNDEVAMLTWTDFRNGDFSGFAAYFPDFAMSVSPSLDTITGSAIYTMHVPEVKLYNSDVVFEAEVETPPSGYFTILYPYGNTLSILPGTLEIFITASLEVPPGDYQVRFSGRGPNGTPVHRRYATVRVLAPYQPEADFTADINEVCEGEPINFFDLSEGSPTSWAWAFIGGYPPFSSEQNPEGIVYTVPGNYNITLEVANTAGTDDTTKSDYISVSIIPVPPSTANNEFCLGSVPPFLIATGQNISWYDDPLLSHIIATGDTLYVNETFPGAYQYYATQTINGCESSGTKATLTIHPLPDVSLNPFDSVCHGDPPFLLYGGLPEGGIYAGNGVTNNIFDPYAAGPGNHQIRYIIVDTNGCVNSATRPITVKPGPPVSMPPFDPVCLNTEPFELTGGLPEGGHYEGPGVEDGWFDPALAGLGQHPVRYTITDSTGCANAIEQNLIVNALPTVTLDPFEPVCINQPAVFLDEGQPLGGYYEGDGVEGEYFIPNEAGTGSHMISYHYTDANGCRNSDTGYIEVKNSTPLNPIADTIVCAGETVWLDATTSGIVSYYWWPDGETSPSILIDSSGYGLGEHMFVIRGTNSNLCTSSDTVMVTFIDCAFTPELTSPVKVSFYPNPVSGSLILEIQTAEQMELTIKILNSLGTIASFSGKTDLNGHYIKHLDVTNLVPGNYYLIIENKRERISGKIIIK